MPDGTGLMRVLLTAMTVDRVNSFVHIHQILDVAFMNLGNADRVVRFGVSPMAWVITVVFTFPLG